MVLVLLSPTAISIPLHEWAGVVIFIPLMVHILIDWKWIVNVTKHIFGTQTAQTRFNYCWDWLLFIVVTVAFVSGVVISEAALPALGFKVEIDPFWTGVHIIASRVLMMLLGVHIAMHWNWLVSALKRPVDRAPARDIDNNREIGKSSLSLMRSTFIPVLMVVLAGALITLTVLPLASAQWAQGFRTAVSASLQEEVPRPKGIVTVVTDLYWIALIIGIPALLTLGILRLGRHFRK